LRIHYFCVFYSIQGTCNLGRSNNSTGPSDVAGDTSDRIEVVRHSGNSGHSNIVYFIIILWRLTANMSKQIHIENVSTVPSIIYNVSVNGAGVETQLGPRSSRRHFRQARFHTVNIDWQNYKEVRKFQIWWILNRSLLYKQ